jgi:ribosome-binding factor A
MVSRKKLEIAQLLRREISTIILCELRDPRIGFVTVTRVELAGDERSAKVFVLARGNEEQVTRSMRALQHAGGRVQALVAERLKLRFTPVLRFVEDKEVREALRVDRLIDSVKAQDAGDRSSSESG